MKTIRTLPPVCLLISLLRLISGKLRFSKTYHGKQILNSSDEAYTIFRHVLVHPKIEGSDNCVFMVRFKFAHLSHRANKAASIIPMLLITGLPGFMQKMYAVDPDSGYWSGVYQWRTQLDLEAYKQSFVFKMMNKRAVRGSIVSEILAHKNITELIQNKTSK